MENRKCPGEVLKLIFEQLHYNAPESCGAVRLASKVYKALVDPIVYRHLTLNDALVKCFDLDDEPNISQDLADTRRRVASAIRTFTRQITIDRPFKWKLVVSIILSLDQFHHLIWYSWYRDEIGQLRHARPTQILKDIFCSTVKRWPSAKFSVDGLTLGLSFGPIETLPLANNLVSLKEPFLKYADVLERARLKTFLLQCHQLKVLHLLNREFFKSFKDEEIELSERLPPLEELFLGGYVWRHSPRIATSFWNWSRLTSLRLEKVSIIPFLESVSPENLLQLRSLVTDGHCRDPADYSEATKLMIELVMAIKSLETLKLVCSVNMFPLDAIQKHGPGLRHLQLINYKGVVHLPLCRDRVTPLSLGHLLGIQSSCPKLMQLGLDVDQGETV